MSFTLERTKANVERWLLNFLKMEQYWKVCRLSQPEGIGFSKNPQRTKLGKNCWPAFYQPRWRNAIFLLNKFQLQMWTPHSESPRYS